MGEFENGQGLKTLLDFLQVVRLLVQVLLKTSRPGCFRQNAVDEHRIHIITIKLQVGQCPFGFPDDHALRIKDNAYT